MSGQYWLSISATKPAGSRTTGSLPCGNGSGVRVGEAVGDGDAVAAGKSVAVAASGVGLAVAWDEQPRITTAISAATASGVAEARGVEAICAPEPYLRGLSSR